jgi:hypothetical protein
MGMARTLEDIGAGTSEGVYLSAEQKEEVYAQGYAFMITDAQPVKESAEYDPQTVFTVKFSEKPGKAPGWAANAPEWYLAFSRTDYREKQAGRILGALATDPEPIGPNYLSKYPLKNGKFSWNVGSKQDSPAERKARAGNPAPDADVDKAFNPDNPDDLPF